MEQGKHPSVCNVGALKKSLPLLYQYFLFLKTDGGVLEFPNLNCL